MYPEIDSDDYASQIDWQKIRAVATAALFVGGTLIIPALNESAWWCIIYAITLVVAGFFAWMARDDLRDLDVLAERRDTLIALWVMIAIALMAAYAVLIVFTPLPAIPWPVGAVITLAFAIWFWRDSI